MGEAGLQKLQSQCNVNEDGARAALNSAACQDFKQRQERVGWVTHLQWSLALSVEVRVCNKRCTQYCVS
jgi:hypothetical protein